LEREGPFLKDLLAAAPGDRVVDLACGTGLHALFFAEAGARVTALDVSPEMIAHAQARRPHVRIAYGVGDMRTPEGSPWDLAVCLGNSISLLASATDVTRTFAGVHDVLAPGGLFVVQVLNYAASTAEPPRHRVDRKESDGREVVAVKSLVPQGDRTLLSLAFFAVGDTVDSVSETAVLRHVDRDELERAATAAGLLVRGTYGSFNGTPYDPAASSDLIAVFEKAM
jgi:SAM-dependent methyltransferase